MTEAKVTVCIPTYWRAELLRQTLHSLVDQGLRVEEYVVAISDNASPDHTPEVVREFKDKLNIVYQRNSENLGMQRNWELALDLSQTPYLAWLPDDDLLAPGQLGRALEAFESHPAAVLVASLTVMQPYPGAPHSSIHGMITRASVGTPYNEPYVWSLTEWLAVALVDTPLSLIGSVFQEAAFRRCERWKRYQLWADRLLLAEMGLYGDVLTLPWVGGYYRIGSHQANAQMAQQFAFEFDAVTSDIQEMAKSRAVRIDEFWIETLLAAPPLSRPHYLRLLKAALPIRAYRKLKRETAARLGTAMVQAILLEHPGVQTRLCRVLGPIRARLDSMRRSTGGVSRAASKPVRAQR